MLYGTILSAAALAVGAGRGETTFGMDEAMVTTLIVYWLAHVYTKTVSERHPSTFGTAGTAGYGAPPPRGRPGGLPSPG